MRSDPELLVQVPRLARAEVERALRELVRTRNALRVMVQGEPARFRLRNVGPGYDAHWGRRNLLHVKGGE
jgi:hypothetical protein